MSYAYCRNPSGGGVEVECNSHVLDFSKYASETSLSAHVGSWHLIPSSSSSSSYSSSSKSAQLSAKEGEGEGGRGDAIGKLDVGRLNACTNGDKEEEEGGAHPLPGSVCVLIPVRNGQEHLSQCLRSLLTQPQGCPFKILLIDDGSTDGTIDIALLIADEVKRGVFSTSNPGTNTVEQSR